MKTKILGISIWIWALGGLVLVSGGFSAASLFKPNAAVPKQDAPTTSTQLPETRAVTARDLLAEKYFRALQQKIGADYDERAAELELSEQVTAGEAQLKGMKLADAKEERKKADHQCEELANKLRAEERELRKGEEHSLSLRQFERYSSRVVSQLFLKLKYRGSSDPESRLLSDEYRRVRFSVTYEDVMEGRSGGPY